MNWVAFPRHPQHFLPCPLPPPVQVLGGPPERAAVASVSLHLPERLPGPAPPGPQPPPLPGIAQGGAPTPLSVWISGTRAAFVLEGKAARVRDTPEYEGAVCKSGCGGRKGSGARLMRQTAVAVGPPLAASQPEPRTACASSRVAQGLAKVPDWPSEARIGTR